MVNRIKHLTLYLCITLLFSTGNLTMAIKYYEECLSIRRTVFGLHPTLGTVYNNLSDAHRDMQDHEKARKNAQKSLTIKRMFISSNTNTMVISLLSTAYAIFKSGGNATRALSLMDEAYHIREQMGLKHYLTTMIHIKRGHVLLSLEQFHRAAESFEKAVSMLQQDEGMRPRHMAKALRMWGVALKNLGRLEEADQRLNKSLKIIDKLTKENGMLSIYKDDIRQTLFELRDVKRMMETR